MRGKIIEEAEGKKVQYRFKNDGAFQKIFKLRNGKYRGKLNVSPNCYLAGVVLLGKKQGHYQGSA